MQKPMKLQNFNSQEFYLNGEFIRDLILDVVKFRKEKLEIIRLFGKFFKLSVFFLFKARERSKK